MHAQLSTSSSWHQPHVTLTRARSNSRRKYFPSALSYPVTIRTRCVPNRQCGPWRIGSSAIPSPLRQCLLIITCDWSLIDRFLSNRSSDIILLSFFGTNGLKPCHLSIPIISPPGRYRRVASHVVVELLDKAGVFAPSYWRKSNCDPILQLPVGNISRARR